MGIESALYRIVLLLHIAAVIVGFGGVILQGAYNARAFKGPVGAANTILTAAKGGSQISEYAIYAVLPLGIVLIAISDDTFGFGDPWVSASFLVWFAMVGAMHGAVRPAVRTMAERAEAASGVATLEADAEATAASRKLMIGEAATQLLLVIALVLMIWKPGA